MLEAGRETLRPDTLSIVPGYQVLADFKQHIGQIARQGVDGDALVFVVDAIGLVVSHAEIAVRAQKFEQWRGESTVAVI
mgnify:CR=1 FL=1